MKLPKDSVLILIPSYNEGKVIASVIRSVQKEGWHNILVVDDGSRDDTIQEVLKTGVVLLQHKMNLGQGAALQTGFEWAKNHNFDVTVTYDSDGQFMPSDIVKVATPLLEKKVDVVLGSRFIGKTIHMPLFRKIVLKVGIFITHILSGVVLTDTHNGFRGFSRKALQTITITQPRMAHASEIIDEIARHKLSYIEVPVTVTYDIYDKKKGQSSLNAINILVDILMKKIS